MDLKDYYERLLCFENVKRISNNNCWYNCDYHRYRSTDSQIDIKKATADTFGEVEWLLI